MQMVGPRPLIWHVMRYYAHYGHKEFILCLGYGASHIKNFFLTYQEARRMTSRCARRQVELMQSDISDWSITFVDTGLHSPIGERLRRVRPYLDGDEYFLANYADVLTGCADGRCRREVPPVRCRRVDDDCSTAVVVPLRGGERSR